MCIISILANSVIKSSAFKPGQITSTHQIPYTYSSAFRTRIVKTESSHLRDKHRFASPCQNCYSHSQTSRESLKMSDEWDSKYYSKNAAFVYTLAAPLIELLQPKKGEHILDLGCGSGELTQALVDAGCDVVGVDSSYSMIQLCKEKGLDARLIDAHDLSFENEFDAVFSNAALHWMSKNPQRVIQNVQCCLRKNGRFVGEFGGQGNLQNLLRAAKQVLEQNGLSYEERQQFYFPSQEEYTSMLESEGFKVEHIWIFSRDTPIPTGPSGLMKLFGNGLLSNIAETEKQNIIEQIETIMRPWNVDSHGVYLADYVRLRFFARKCSHAT